MHDRLTVDEHPDEADLRFLEERVAEYNIAATGIPFARDTGGGMVAVIVRDDDGAVIAGLSAFTWGGVLDIRYLWVRGDSRGQGYGTRLMAAAEEEARARGCHQAVVDTHSFQAPTFYQKLGYTVYGVLDDYPPGHQKIYLKKNLR